MPEIVPSVLCFLEMLNMLLSFQRIKETKKLVPVSEHLGVYMQV